MGGAAAAAAGAECNQARDHDNQKQKMTHDFLSGKELGGRRCRRVLGGPEFRKLPVTVCPRIFDRQDRSRSNARRKSRDDPRVTSFLPATCLSGRFDAGSPGGHHDSMHLIPQQCGARRAKPRGQNSIGRRWRAAALQMAQNRQSRFDPGQFFQLLGQLQRVADMVLVKASSRVDASFAWRLESASFLT